MGLVLTNLRDDWREWAGQLDDDDGLNPNWTDLFADVEPDPESKVCFLFCIIMS